MSGDDRTEAAIAEQALDLVRRGDPAAAAEITVTRAALALTRFANSAIHQNVADETVTVSVKVHTAGRTSAGSSSIVEGDGLERLVSRTLDAARVAPLDPGWPGVAPRAAVSVSTDPDPATAFASPDVRAQMVKAFVDAGGGLETAGYCRTSRWSAAFVNSLGQAVTATAAEASINGIARTGGADGVARFATDRVAELDAAALGARAAAKARAGIDPVEWPPDRYEVVLEPAAVVDVLQGLAVYGFSGKAVQEGRSFVDVGKEQFDPAVTLVDDAPAIGDLFDAEGTPRRRSVLVDRGLTAAVVHDRRTARDVGSESTGHATGSAAWGPVPLHLAMLAAAGGTAIVEEVDGPMADSSVAALVADVERGVLVSDLWYTRVLDPKTLVTTGLTRNGLWAIENGEVTRPLTNFRFTQSYATVMGAGTVLGVGDVVTAQPDSWIEARWSAPAVRLQAWNFTGGASG